MEIPLDYILWMAIVCVSFVPLFILFFWLGSKFVDNKIRKKLLDFYVPKPEEVELPEFVNSDSQLYVCQNLVGREKCNYNLLPTIAMGINKCPECGHTYSDLNNIDHLMAKSLMLNKRIKTDYMTYLVYEPVVKEGKMAFCYCRSILASSQEAADKMVRERLYPGGQHLIMRADSFPVSKAGLNFIPPVLIVSNPPDVLGSMEEGALSISEANSLTINRITPSES